MIKTKNILKVLGIAAIITAVTTPFWAIPYTITLNAEEGSCETETLHAQYTDVVILPAASKEHYQFEGWTTGDSEETTPITGIDHLLKNITLTAVYTPEKYNLTFYDGEDELTDMAQTYTYGIKTELPVLSKDHYTFAGWKNGEDTIAKIESGTFGDMKLDAEWIPDTYTITFEPNGGTMPDEYVTSYEYGVGTDWFPKPTKDGYVFSRWYEDEELTIPSDFVGKTEYGDKVYYAEWKKPVVKAAPSNTANAAAAYYGGGPRVIVGGYSAMLYYVDLYNVEQTNGVINAPYSAARWTLFSGADYIADHAYQGFGAMLGANTLTIVEADGSVKTLHKSSTHYGTDWLCDDGVNVLEANAALVTQTCVGGGRTAFAFWDY